MSKIPPTRPDSLSFNSLLMNAIPGNHLVLLPDAPRFTIVAVSDDYLTALNLQREPLLGNGVFEVFFSDGGNQAGAQQLIQSLTQVVQTKQTQSITDLRYERSHYETYILEGRAWRVTNKPVMDPEGELCYIINTVEDITSEVQLVEVAQANRYLQTIINLFKEPMQVLQPIQENGEIIDFRFTLTNQAYAAYANATPEQLQGKRVSEVFPGYKETESFRNPVETYKTGKPLTFEIHYEQDGLDLYNLMNTAKLGEEVVIHFTDFTRLRHLQLQLESKIRELSRSNQSLQEFAYVASHDLQEPLRKIQLFGEMLRGQRSDALGDGVDYLQRMQTAASRMSTLIQDLLAYSRISAQADQTTPVSLSNVLSLSLADLDLLIEETGAQVTLDPLPTVLGDSVQLGQLFQNLLSNAVKFRRADLPLRIQVRYRHLRAGDLPSRVKPIRQVTSYHLIEVADNGIGFHEKYSERIFQVFQRLHGKTQYAGTGIGLAICEKVVANHGGAITASSQAGQGATFSVYLPV